MWAKRKPPHMGRGSGVPSEKRSAKTYFAFCGSSEMELRQARTFSAGRSPVTNVIEHFTVVSEQVHLEGSRIGTSGGLSLRSFCIRVIVSGIFGGKPLSY